MACSSGNARVYASVDGTELPNNQLAEVWNKNGTLIPLDWLCQPGQKLWLRTSSNRKTTVVLKATIYQP